MQRARLMLAAHAGPDGRRGRRPLHASATRRARTQRAAARAGGAADRDRLRQPAPAASRPSMLGIVQSAFGNVAEFALTIARAAREPARRRAHRDRGLDPRQRAPARRHRRPRCPRCAPAGASSSASKFERQLFSSIATLAVVAVVPIGHPQLRHRRTSSAGDAREDISLAAGIGLLADRRALPAHRAAARTHRPRPTPGFAPLLSRTRGVRCSSPSAASSRRSPRTGSSPASSPRCTTSASRRRSPRS